MRRERRLRLEALEPRVLLSATLVNPLDDLSVMRGAPNSVVDLADTFTDPAISGTTIEFYTPYGWFDAELYDAAAPQTVANFLNYVNSGRYDDTLIHRSVPGLLIQGGGFTYPDWLSVVTDPAVPNEPGISNTRGTLAMAKLDGQPDSATSQWFINLADNTSLDTDNGGYTVFGHVLGDGMSVVDAIGAEPTYDLGVPFESIPLYNYTTYPNWPGEENLILVYSAYEVDPIYLWASSDNPTLVSANLSGTDLTLQYAPDQFGTATVTVFAYDLTGGMASDSFTVSVQGRPAANDDEAATDQGQAIAVPVLDNDVPLGPPIDPTTVAIATAPLHGLAEADPVTGAVTYTPAADYFGTETFTYTVADTEGGVSDPATVSVFVNGRPVVTPMDDLVVKLGGADTRIDLFAYFSDPEAPNPYAFFDTVMGQFYVELYQDATPQTVANFLNYVADGDYTSSIIHRSVPDFVVQGGGITYPGWYDVPTDAPVVNEPGILNTRGTIAMAKQDGDPNSATSQWFFNLVDNTDLDTQNGGFTVFGEVWGNGMDVIDAIAALPTYDFGDVFANLPLIDYTDYPNEPAAENVVLVNNVTIESSLTFEVTNDNPTLLTATISNGRLLLDYAADQLGTATITIRATDQGALFVEDSFTVEVKPMPVAANDEADTDQGQPIAIPVLDNDVPQGPPIDPTTVAVGAAALHGLTEVDPVTGAITYTPAADFYGMDTFTYTVADEGGGVSDPATVTVYVNGIPVVKSPFGDLRIDLGGADTRIDLYAYFSDPESPNPYALFDTVMGQFYVELYQDATPQTVANFINYVADGDYTSSIIHRSVADFVVQGGGFSYPAWVDVPTDPPVVNEPGISNTRGTIAMAKVGSDPNSATSQWFFNLADNSAELDTQNGGFTVFGEVWGYGMDVVDAIAALPTYAFSDPFTSLPLINYTDYPNEPAAENIVLVNAVTVESSLTFEVLNDNPTLLSATISNGRLLLDYAADQMGTATITIRATDPRGLLAEDSFTVDVERPPVAHNDKATGTQDQPLDIAVLANDVGQDRALDPASVAIGTAPSHGSIDLDPATGIVTYTPAEGYHGLDSLTYTVADVGGWLSGAATVSIDINALPVLVTPFQDIVAEQGIPDTVLDLTGFFIDPDIAGTLAHFDTVFGDFYVELYDTATPLTVANFLKYVSDGDYTNSVIHRSVADFVVQGGIYSYPSWSAIPTDAPVQNEPGISNTRGTIAMAKLGSDPNSATSSWFINLADNSADLDSQNGGFTVFGYVLGDGMSVVDAIAAVPTYDFGGDFAALPLIDYTTYPAMPADENVVLVHGITARPPVVLSVTTDNAGLLTPSFDGQSLILAYVPGAWGTATVTVRGTDLAGTYVEGSFLVTVTGPPMANDDVAATDPGAPIIINPLANDTEQGRPIDPTAVALVSLPQHGTAVLDPDTGLVTYTPPAGFVGPDPFTYTVQDVDGRTSRVATVTVTINQQGILLGTGYASTLKYEDPDHTQVTLKVTNGLVNILLVGFPGTIEIGTKTDTVSDPVDIYCIEILDSSIKTTLSFSTKYGEAPGATLVGLTGSTPVGKLTGSAIDLAGDGIAMTGDGYIASVTLRDVLGGADILMPGTGATKGISLSLHDIHDHGTDITLGSYLKSLTAARYVGSTLTAPWASSITIKGDTKLGLAGNIGADIHLTGGAPKDTLGKASIAGQILAGTWDIAGSVGGIYAGGALEGWVLDADGAVKTLSAKGTINGTITAAWFSKIYSSFYFSANLTATGADPKGNVSIGSFSAVWGDDCVIDVPGGIKSIKVSGWEGGGVHAAWLSSLSTSTNSRLGLTGDFEAYLSLTGEGQPKLVLSRASIAGSINSCVWDIAGPVGSITAKGGADGWYCGAGGAIGSLKLGVVTDTNVVANGPIGSLLAVAWDSGTIWADSLKSLKTTADKKTNTPGHFMANLRLSGTGVPDGKASLGSVNVSDYLAYGEWDITGNIGSIFAGGGLYQWTLAAHNDINSLKLGYAEQANITADGAIASCLALNWKTGTVKANYIKKINPTFGTDLSVEVAGYIDTLTALWWKGGTIKAGAIKTLSITGATSWGIVGDCTANLNITGIAGVAEPLGSAKIAATLSGATWDVAGNIGTLSVVGWAKNSHIHSTGNIRSISLGGMDTTVVYAGVASSVTGFPDPATAFAGAATIRKLTITGVKGVSGPYFINSSIAAPTLSSVSIREVQMSNSAHNGDDFGIAATTIGSLSWRQGSYTYTWRNRWRPETGDFVVRNPVV